jgi:hypothetical protein
MMNKYDWMYAWCIGMNVAVTVAIVVGTWLEGRQDLLPVALTLAWCWGCFAFTTYGYVKLRRSGVEVKL